MTMGRKIAIVVYTALVSAGLYSLAWLAVSHFVSADTISHFYVDTLLNRWWGALFIPGYIVAIFTIYFWGINKARIAVWFSLAVGLAGGVWCSIIDVMSHEDLFEKIVFWSTCSAATTFLIAFLLFFLCRKKFDYVVDWMFTVLLFGVFGLSLGVGVYFSPLNVLLVFGFSVFVLIFAMIAGSSVVIFVASILSFLVWLHRTAFGKNEKKDKKGKKKRKKVLVGVREVGVDE